MDLEGSQKWDNLAVGVLVLVFDSSPLPMALHAKVKGPYYKVV